MLEGSGLPELGRSRYAAHRTWWKLTHRLKWNSSAGVVETDAVDMYLVESRGYLRPCRHFKILVWQAVSKVVMYAQDHASWPHTDMHKKACDQIYVSCSLSLHTDCPLAHPKDTMEGTDMYQGQLPFTFSLNDWHAHTHRHINTTGKDQISIWLLLAFAAIVSLYVRTSWMYSHT